MELLNKWSSSYAAIRSKFGISNESTIEVELGLVNSFHWPRKHSTSKYTASAIWGVIFELSCFLQYYFGYGNCYCYEQSKAWKFLSSKHRILSYLAYYQVIIIRNQITVNFSTWFSSESYYFSIQHAKIMSCTSNKHHFFTLHIRAAA